MIYIENEGPITGSKTDGTTTQPQEDTTFIDGSFATLDIDFPTVDTSVIEYNPPFDVE